MSVWGLPGLAICREDLSVNGGPFNVGCLLFPSLAGLLHNEAIKWCKVEQCLSRYAEPGDDGQWFARGDEFLAYCGQPEKFAKKQKRREGQSRRAA